MQLKSTKRHEKSQKITTCINISGVNDFSRFTRLILHITDLLAYFISTALFRIWSIALFFSYLKEFGCIPILIFWVINVIYGYSKYVISFAVVILNKQNIFSSLREIFLFWLFSLNTLVWNLFSDLQWFAKYFNFERLKED